MSVIDWEDATPQPDEFSEFYKGYIELVNTPNVIQTLIRQGQQMYGVIQQLSEEEANYRYADGKWSVKQILGHLIDTERIMGYRALCISRGETKSLPGYDQDDYVDNANFDERTLQSLSTEYDALRNANISMFSSFNKKQIERSGMANGVNLSVRALAFIIAGHEKHHMNVLEEKYGVITSPTQSKN